MICAEEATKREPGSVFGFGKTEPGSFLEPRGRGFVASSLVFVLLLAGCQKALFPKDEPRTQFDLHDRTTGYSPPLEHYDVFGNPQPALRERLTQPQ